MVVCVSAKVMVLMSAVSHARRNAVWARGEGERVVVVMEVRVVKSR